MIQWIHLRRIPFIKNREVQGDYERPADIYLKEKLLAESAGILAWLVRGSIGWQQRGLDPPVLVMEASAEYRRDEDDLADFIDEECYLDPEAECSAKILYMRFVEWWEANINKKKVPKTVGQPFESD